MQIGLTEQQAQQRLAQQGENRLAAAKRKRPLSIFLGQFRDVMVLILLAATVISALLGEITDAVTIILIVLLNAVLGFVQEYRTERTLEALSAMTAPTARVFRDGTLTTRPAAELVNGDVIRVEAGDRVPADCRILRCRGLFAEESVLTGESVPVGKHPGAPEDTDNAPGKDTLLYTGTGITQGAGEAVVIATGTATQVGQISSMLSQIEAGRTPLQERLGELGKTVAIICLAVCLIVFGAGVLRGEPVFDMLLTGITIAIAAIPEGLPATVTIALALAVNRMLRANALVNRLHAVETLGCTSVICSDKTGTITENRMTVTRLFAGGELYEVRGSGYRITGEIRLGKEICNPAAKPDLTALLRCGVLCSNAAIRTDREIRCRQRGSISAAGDWQVQGDPTEIALLVAASKAGVTARSLSGWKRMEEEPFDSDTRCMTVLARSGSRCTAFCKGAADVLLPRCAFYMQNGTPQPMTLAMRQSLTAQAQLLSGRALRVLALTEKDCDSLSAAEYGLTFLGFSGMEDPVRQEAKEAIRRCRSAQIRTVMITGDHPATAKAVAAQAGLLRGRQVLTGAELDDMPEEILRRQLDRYSVFARVSPAHKLRLVRAYRSRGEIVTMTGDGVNDAPAIKEADVGVAMGLTGTDVAKQAADVILLDDNFATLVGAVEQGRCIYANIRKFVRYLLSCNIGEVLTMFLGILMGMPMVLLPVQLLLVNLVTDGLPAIALGLEPPERGNMEKPPRRPEESFFSGGLLGTILLRGVLIGLSTLACFSLLLHMGCGVAGARTGALTTLVLSQLLHVFECKSEQKNIFTVPYLNNGKLVLAVLASLLCLFGAIYVPALQTVFSTVALSGAALLRAVGLSLAVPLVAALIPKGR